MSQVFRPRAQMRWRSRARQAYNRLQRALCGLLWWERTYHEDGLATEHNCDFLRDERFARAYAAGRATGSFRGREIRWRAHVACWAAEHAAQIEGDFVECGVYRGGLARAIVEYVGFQALDKRFYLFDTYAGIPDEAISEDERRLGRQAGEYDECYDAVCETFRPFPNVRVIRGIVPQSLANVQIERVAYLSLDMNVHQPEIAAAEHLWPRMSKGGIILLDDYGFRAYAPQKEAFDAFAARHGVPILTLPTGQGLILVT